VKEGYLLTVNVVTSEEDALLGAIDEMVEDLAWKQAALMRVADKWSCETAHPNDREGIGVAKAELVDRVFYTLLPFS
jgi:hypothetical protein